jgi:hypothetical protein
VTLSAANGEIRYTLDGSAVTTESTRYERPFALPDGGIVRAGVFAAPGSSALVLATSTEASATFGIALAGASIVDCSSEQGGGEAAAKAIDGDPRTHWHSRWSPDSPQPPHHLTIDLGRAVALRGFVYQPRASGDNGTVLDYRFEGSVDGKSWRELAKGSFANIAANPVPQVVRFAAAMDGARFVRFTALREVQGRAWASCAELSVLTR